MIIISNYVYLGSKKDGKFILKADTSVRSEFRNCYINGGENVEYEVTINGKMIADQIYTKSSLTKEAISIGLYIENLAMLLVDKGFISKEEFDDCVNAFTISRELTKET
ncbi:hypothetical protein D3C81_996550 [compost metagenome]